MKGTINLKSELGKGSTFTVKIPEIAFKREFINSKITIQVNPSDLIFDPCTILVVDDVEHNRSFIRDTLRNTSITVIEADEGFKALKLAKKVIPTLIISDIRMPNMDGFELLSKLKANKKLKHIPVLAYSASVLKDQKERIHKSQFVGLLTKPVNITELFLELMNHLPYKEAIKKKTDQTTDISKSEIKDLKSLISSLESDFMEVWKNFEIRQPIGEIKKFGEDLIRLGTDHNSNLVKKYGNDLLTAGESFNIEAILILLKQYSVNLENLKTLV
jgi:CheY-like chemotaxis protein